MGPEDLAHVLRPFASSLSPELLVGLHTADDAAVYKLNEEQAVVQTLDFFPPIVDDPYTFGAITAANAASDVYAMGGRPLFALNIAAWPSNLPLDMLSEIFRGGQEKMAEAGAVVAGGHTVTDDVPKYGLCVTGVVHPGRVTTKGGARPGDKLVLTKPLGTGIVTTALKRERATEEDLRAAVASMTRLNKLASEVAVAAGVVAMTDVTGFGLLGHAYEMAAAGGVQLRIRLGTLPLLPGVDRYFSEGLVPGGLNRNRDYLQGAGDGQPRAGWEPSAPEQLLAVALDPQTSGGLLMAVPERSLPALAEHATGVDQQIWVVGEVAEGRGVQVIS
jgi:selenide,water dikinase